ncbi:MAG: hypothetical protein KF745_09695 [Phycisphaeraceae bacterium]|nr:hypothetical protein [Phycisphaeraceae bacterium]
MINVIRCVVSLVVPALRAAAGAAALVVLAPGAIAQIYQRAVGTLANETAYAIEETFDCGYITAGEIRGAILPGGPPTNGIHVVKFKYEGPVEWSGVLDTGPNARTAGYSVHGVRTGGYIVGGETTLFPGFGIVLLRVDALGNHVWARCYQGTPFLDFPAGVAVRQTFDGGFVCVGRIQPAAGGPTSGTLLKVDGAGNPLFQRIYIAPGIQGSMSFSDVREDAAGFIVSGTLLDAAIGLERAFLLRTDPGGNPLGYREFIQPNKRLFGDGLDVNTTGDIALIGRSLTPPPVVSASFLLRTDPVFVPAWTVEIPRFVVGFAAVRWTRDPSIVIAGTTVPAAGGITSAAMLRFSGAGALGLARQYGGALSTEGHAINRPQRRLAYAIAGTTTITPTNGGNDVYLVVPNLLGVTTCLEGPGPQETQLAITTSTRQLAATFLQGFEFMPQFSPLPVGEIVYCSRGCPADFDGDGVVTPADIAQFVTLWNASLMAGTYGGDFDCDGFVTPSDIAVFVSTWNAALSFGCP